MNADRSCIVEVDTDEGGWKAVPVAIFNDSRLDATARGVMGWFLTRPAGWEIRIEAMRRANNLTEYAWQKNILKQLVDAGYLVASKVHVDGKLMWKYKVFPVSKIPLILRNQGLENAALNNIKLDANIVDLISQQLAKEEAKKQQMISRSRDKATKRDKVVAELERKVDDLIATLTA